MTVVKCISMKVKMASKTKDVLILIRIIATFKELLLNLTVIFTYIV